jgi:hypothetical protein
MSGATPVPAAAPAPAVASPDVGIAAGVVEVMLAAGMVAGMIVLVTNGKRPPAGAAPPAPPAPADAPALVAGGVSGGGVTVCESL